MQYKESIRQRGGGKCSPQDLPEHVIVQHLGGRQLLIFGEEAAEQLEQHLRAGHPSVNLKPGMSGMGLDAWNGL